MKFKLALPLFFVSFMTFAQNHTTPGGGIPDMEPKPGGKCEILDLAVSEKEKAYVESFKQKYVSEADFAVLIQKVALSQSLKLLEDIQVPGKSKAECHDQSKKQLKEILIAYKDGSSRINNCPEFIKRAEQIDQIEKVLKFHGI